MSDYMVRAVRWSGGWELHITDVGVTQTTGLADAETMVRDYLRIDDYPDWENSDIEIVIDLDGLEDEVAESRREVAVAAQAQIAAAEHSRQVASKLRQRGLSINDTAKVMGVSRARVSQLT